MANKDLGFVIHRPGGDPNDWRPCIRVDEHGARPMVMRPVGCEEDANGHEHDELLDLEYLAPGVASVRNAYGRPPMVNSRSYEEGWERIFGGAAETGQA